MKVVILAGGYGTRLSEETDFKPKPMIEIGGKPIIWHIMKYYSFYGFNDFIILLGYKGYVIKEYFSNYFLHNSSITIDLTNNSLNVLDSESEPWKVTLLDTGIDTMTGGRLKRASKFLSDEAFLLTYGDGLCDANLNKLIKFHKDNNKLMTLTAVRPEGRYGQIQADENDNVLSFQEKVEGEEFWINGGFFVCEPKVLDFIKNDDTVFENEPMSQLTKNNNLCAMKHSGFWGCMDTLRDKKKLNDLWNKQKAPWKVWT